VICNQQYVGQTVNKFSIEWTSHPSNWNKPDIMDDSDQIVSPRNYSVFHDIIHKPTVYQALTATFVKQPSFHSLDTCEDQCFDKRNANHTLIFKAWYFLVWNAFVLFATFKRDLNWFSHWALLTFFDLSYHSRSNRHWHFPGGRQTSSAMDHVEKFIATGDRICHICLPQLQWR